MSSASPSTDETRTNGGKPRTDKPPKGKKLSQAKSIKMLEENAATLIADLAPELIEGIQRTDGTTPATLTLVAKYHPASSGASARIDLDGKITVPGVGFSHKVAFTKPTAENEDPQLALFAPTEG